MSQPTPDVVPVVMGSSALPFSVSHGQQPPAEVLADDGVLGVFCYGAPPATLHDPRLLTVPLELLDGSAQVDVLRSVQPVVRGVMDGFSYAHNADVLLAQLSVEATASRDIELQTFEAYRRITRLLDESGFPHSLRVWNYLGNINHGEGDDEIDKQFCLGRARALQIAVDSEESLPAASAIGSQDAAGTLVIHLLATKTPGIQVENPRQVSAFHYPRQYGIRSPSFSRARIMRWSGVSHLYLSGTASVVGHETLHVGDCRAQLEESLRNMDAVLEVATTAAGAEAHFTRDHLRLLRVYLRHRTDLAMARACIESHMGSTAAVAYLLGDICRQDLLVEIEGLYCHPA